jgi:L-ascorbate metabolism protein UlaG (beta-lactamase superfamily)
MRFLISLTLSLLLALPALAQARRPSHCIALANAAPGLSYLHLASVRDPVPEYSVRISYIDHATFLIETEGGLSVATDYTGFIGVTQMPLDVVTMNHAHTSHWTFRALPDIPHVLRGWGEPGAPARHHLDLGEMLIRNVTTDIRAPGGVGTETDGNSIFVFEVAGLCIGHLGHLHHEPTAAQYAALGRLDVVMAAVDGGQTVDLETMTRILTRLQSSIVIPMHWFGDYTLNRFLSEIDDGFAIERPGSSAIEISLRSLPRRPTVVVLRPAFLREPFD